MHNITAQVANPAHKWDFYFYSNSQNPGNKREGWLSDSTPNDQEGRIEILITQETQLSATGMHTVFQILHTGVDVTCNLGTLSCYSCHPSLHYFPWKLKFPYFVGFWHLGGLGIGNTHITETVL